MQSRLLGAAEWKRLLGASGTEELTAQLAQWGLVSSASLGVADVQRELRQRCIGCCERLARFLGGRAKSMLCHFVYFYDLLNLEVVISGLHGEDGGPSRNFGLYRTGSLGAFRPEDLEVVTSFAMLGDVLDGTVFASPYSIALSRYAEDEDLPAFLSQLECTYLAEWHRAARRCGPWLPRSTPSLFDLFVACRTISWALRMRYGRRLGEHEIHRCLSLLLRGDELAFCESALRVEEPHSALALLTGALLPRGVAAKLSAESFDMRRIDVQFDRVLCDTARLQRRPVRFSAEYLIGYHMLNVLEAENIARLLEARALGATNEDLSPYLVGVA